MASTQTVTLWIQRTQQGHDSAAALLLDTYFQRLIGLARKRLRNIPGLDAYEEDVALQSFDSLCRRLRNTDNPLELSSRDDLWRLLATKTVCRAIDLIRRHKTAPHGESDLEQLLSRDPTPEEANEMADECRRLLDLLAEPELRQIALWKVEGFTNEEIAIRLGCVLRTVERKIARIRLLWQEELQGLDS